MQDLLQNYSILTKLSVISVPLCLILGNVILKMSVVLPSREYNLSERPPDFLTSPTVITIGKDAFFLAISNMYLPLCVNPSTRIYGGSDKVISFVIPKNVFRTTRRIRE